MSTDALPASAGIGRVALRVADLEETAAFYEETIGLDVLGSDAIADTVPAPEADGDRAILGAGDEPLLVLEHVPDASPRKPAEAGCYHVAIRVPDRATLGAAIARLRERDLIDGAADHGVSEAVYCRDPAGNGLELYADRPREEWPIVDGQVLMDTLPLDLDALVALADGARVDHASIDDARGDDDTPIDDAPGGDARTDGVPADAASLPDGTAIGHVHLEVTDLEETEGFYADALGMGVRQRMGNQALFLAAGDYHHHVGANTWRGRSAAAGVDSLGLAWFEVVVPSDDALDDVAARLDDAGVAVERTNGGEILAVADPDGIRLRLRVDTAIAAPTGE